MDNQPKTAGEPVSRRSFLSYSLGLSGLAFSALLGVPLAGFALNPALVKENVKWLEVINIEEIPADQPLRVNVKFRRKDGWAEKEETKSIWVVKLGGEVIAYSALCTHLGCAYTWREEQKVFYCPCHGGMFDIQGNVTGGPPPRPLDRYETKVENGRLLAGRLMRKEG
ncbi:MAG: ubiquinol-cytochrome c reductase iron-sulfur subunit [Clostridia bacterium]|nr:ubiquinol-cytochrome c reductase iron-sulfur subunit [Clostridia bacterium]